MGENVLVDEKLHMIFRVVHQPHDGDGSGGQIQIFFHEFRPGKGEAGGVDLLGQHSRLKFLLTGHHQQVKFCLLGVAEKQVLANLNAQELIDVVAAIDGAHGVVVQTLIGDI